LDQQSGKAGTNVETPDPGLRPGLSSAVPAGLILQAVLRHTLKPSSTQPHCGTAKARALRTERLAHDPAAVGVDGLSCNISIRCQ
jgi:hypothetical protein